MSDPSEIFKIQLAAFGEQAKSALATANRVTVFPGGASFGTIQAAIDSIPELSGPDSYSVMVGPGTYNEQVTLKPWVMLMGGEADQVTISFPAGREQSFAVLRGAANAGVSGVTVQCEGANWGDYATALAITAADGFNASGCVFTAGDGGHDGVNINTIQLDLLAEQASKVLFGSCQVVAEAQSAQSVTTALSMWNTADFRAISYSAFSARGGLQSFAVIAEAGVTALFQEAKIDSDQWAIFLPQYKGNVVAEDCTIRGTVSEGVIVKNSDTGVPAPKFADPRAAEPVKRFEAKG